MYGKSYLYLYKDNNIIGYAFCSNSNGYLENEGDYFAHLIYSCDTLSVYGKSIINGAKKRIENIDYQFKRGWNLAIQTITEVTDTTIISSSIINNNFNGDWVYKIPN